LVTPDSGLKRARDWLRVPTTAAGCELAILIVFMGIRGLNLAQLGIAAAWGLPSSTHPWLAATCMVTFAATTVLILVTTVRRRQYRDGRLAILDLTVVTAILLLQRHFTSAHDITSWKGGWPFPVAMAAVSSAGIALHRQMSVAVSVVGIAAIYLTTTLPAAPDSGQRLTVVVNSLAFVAFGTLSMIASRFLRRLGADSDAARAAAADAGRAAELDRHRLLLHDQETVLRLLSEPELDPSLAALLQKQAAHGASQIRSFMSGASSSQAGDGTLAASVDLAAAQFADLPMTVSTHLATDVVLEPEVAAPLGQAIVTLLHNVRVHAKATSVVVHAAGDDHEGWEVSVHDNGRGFDPGTTCNGFGLDKQVQGALAPHNIATHINATEGEGTLVILRFAAREFA
jgi:signal transduction histidine kinase